MIQAKIYGLEEYLDLIKAQLSEIIHVCIIDALHKI